MKNSIWTMRSTCPQATTRSRFFASNGMTVDSMLGQIKKLMKLCHAGDERAVLREPGDAEEGRLRRSRS